MHLSEVLAALDEEEEMAAKMNKLLDIPKSQQAELAGFKARITTNGIDRMDATWLTNEFSGYFKTPLTLDTYSDTPTQVGLSDALQAIAEVEACTAK